MEAGICCMRFRPTRRWTSSEEEKRRRFLSPMEHSAQRSTGPWRYIFRIDAAIGSLPGNHERDHGSGGEREPRKRREIAVSSFKVSFDAMEWQQIRPDVRQKVYCDGARQVRLVEF